jgi:prefoldin subunit 5
MAATQDEIDARLNRLERDFQELASAVSGALGKRAARTDAAMNRISFGTWLQITGPTFATMVLGFSLLWNAQQVTHANLLEIQRVVGRLEGSLNGLDARIEGLDARIESLDARIESLDARIESLDARIVGLDARLQTLDTRLEHLADAVSRLAQRVGSS